MAAVKYVTRNLEYGTGEYGIQTSTCRRQNNHGRVYIEMRQQQITRTHTAAHMQAITHTHTIHPSISSLSLSLSVALALSQLLSSGQGDNNTSWPTFRCCCLCRRRCQRRKQGGVRNRRTLIKHSQLSESPHIQANAQDGWRRKKRARVQARAREAGASETARCGRVKCDECAIILLYVCRERAALLFFQLRFLT